MSSDSSLEDSHRSYKKKRRHETHSPERSGHDRRHPGADGHRHRHKHDKHGHRDRPDRERPRIKTERQSPEGGYRRSRSPVARHGRPDHDRKPVIKLERPDRGHSRGEREGHDRAERRHHDRRREDHRRQQGNEEWGNLGGEPKKKKVPTDKPDFGLSGKLTEETNTYKGVVIKYNEPAEARKPRKRWRLYPFKGDEALPVMHIHRQSAFLFGRDRRVADLPVDHPSCSKQHAVLQYRLVDYKRDSGVMGRKIKPYIIDLGSANGTYVNNQRIESERYVELIEKDVVKFGFSSREYVILHDNVQVDEDDEENT